jgi:hypothetical protein
MGIPIMWSLQIYSELKKHLLQTRACITFFTENNRGNPFKTGMAKHWWLSPIIPATQEAEIRRIEV